MRKWSRSSIVRRIGLTVVVLLVLLSGTAWAYDGYASAEAVAQYPPPGQLVTVNGARMHVICQGSGEPTLVLVAGFGGGAIDWLPVMPGLAERRRVCAVDRFGQDWSDPMPAGRTFGTAADELAQALGQLGITRPIVVGHSMGGAIVQIAAARSPVAGIVLVDGLTTDIVDPVVDLRGNLKALGPLASLGLLRPLGPTIVDPAYPEPLRQEMIALRSRSSALNQMAEEGAVAKQTAGAELRAAEARYSAPLLIIAAGKTQVPGLPAGAFPEALKALAGRKPNTTFRLVPESNHYVQAEYPNEVVAAINTWAPTLR